MDPRASARRTAREATSDMNLGSFVVLAHQGGWDELVVFVIPLVLFGGLMLIDHRRRNR